jgi:hypothetical protein
MSSFVFRITGRRTASIDTPNIEHLSPLSFFRVTRCIINLHDALAASDFALTHSISLHPTPAFPLFSRAASVKSCGENVQGGTVVYPWKCGSNGQGGGGPPRWTQLPAVPNQIPNTYVVKEEDGSTPADATPNIAYPSGGVYVHIHLDVLFHHGSTGDCEKCPAQ